jgi:hypothetical protein
MNPIHKFWCGSQLIVYLLRSFLRYWEGQDMLRIWPWDMGGVREYYPYGQYPLSLRVVDNFNCSVLNCLSGEKRIYFSSNEVEWDEDGTPGQHEIDTQTSSIVWKNWEYLLTNSQLLLVSYVISLGILMSREDSQKIHGLLCAVCSITQWRLRLYPRKLEERPWIW